MFQNLCNFLNDLVFWFLTSILPLEIILFEHLRSHKGYNSPNTDCSILSVRTRHHWPRERNIYRSNRLYIGERLDFVSSSLFSLFLLLYFNFTFKFRPATFTPEDKLQRSSITISLLNIECFCFWIKRRGRVLIQTRVHNKSLQC